MLISILTAPAGTTLEAGAEIEIWALVTEGFTSKPAASPVWPIDRS
jgi:hypothetical protein